MRPIAPRSPSLVLALALAGVLAPRMAVHAYDVVLNAQGEFMDAYLVNGSALPPKVVFIDPDPANPDSITGTPPRVGRHVNGKLCFFPRGVGHNGQFVVADDTYREACLDRDPPQARCNVTARGNKFYVGQDPDGWAVFKRNGRWKKRHIHTAWEFSQPEPQGNLDPQGCGFLPDGRMFGTDVGGGANPLSRNGSLIVFFPGRNRRYETYCFLDKGLASPGMLVIDEAGNILVPEAAGAQVSKFSPPFPTSAAECDNPDRLVTTPPNKSAIVVSGISTPVSMVRVPGTDHWYLASVLLPPVINEYDANFVLVRNIVANPDNPIGMDVGSDGTLYYAELNLNPDTSTGCGRMQMVRFVGGTPQAPQLLGQNLSFPDGVTVIDSSQVRVDFLKLPPAPEPAPSTCNGSGG